MIISQLLIVCIFYRDVCSVFSLEGERRNREFHQIIWRSYIISTSVGCTTEPQSQLSCHVNGLTCVCVSVFFTCVSTLNGYFVYRVDFESLKDLPVLVLDVNEDFKNDRIKQEGVIEKVSVSWSADKWIHYFKDINSIFNLEHYFVSYCKLFWNHHVWTEFNTVLCFPFFR